MLSFAFLFFFFFFVCQCFAFSAHNWISHLNKSFIFFFYLTLLKKISYLHFASSLPDIELIFSKWFPVNLVNEPLTRINQWKPARKLLKLKCCKERIFFSSILLVPFWSILASTLPSLKLYSLVQHSRLHAASSFFYYPNGYQIMMDSHLYYHGKSTYV